MQSKKKQLQYIIKQDRGIILTGVKERGRYTRRSAQPMDGSTKGAGGSKMEGTLQMNTFYDIVIPQNSRKIILQIF